MERSIQTEDLVANKTILNVDLNKDGKIDGYQFDLKLLFHTSQPIGAIKDLFITVDGKKINPKNVILIVRGQKIPLLYAPTINEIPWPLYSNISVFIEDAGGLKVGKHELECILHLTTTTTYGGEFWDAKGIPYREYLAKVMMTVT